MKTQKEQEKKKALIVDDESDICFLLSNILRQEDIHPMFAGSITEADQILHSSNIVGYIFLDNHLPDGLGINQIKRWKEEFPYARLIMITAHDGREERRKAKVDGVDGFISKPFSRQTILDSLKGSA